MSEFEQRAITYGILLLLGVVGWFLREAANSFKSLKKSVESIKTDVAVHSEKHENIEKRINSMEILFFNKKNHFGNS